MPLYEYCCSSCNHSDTLLEQSNSAKRKKCPACGKRMGFERLISAPAFHLKGNGWYATDFRDGPKSKTDAQDANAAKSDTAKNDKVDGKPDKANGKTDKENGKTEKAVSKPVANSVPASPD